MVRQLGVLLLLTAASFVSASAQIKISIVNVQQAVLDSAEIKKAQVDLETEFKPRQQQFEKMQKDLAALQQQLQTQQGKVTPQAEQDIVARGTKLQRDSQRFGDDLQADVDRRRNEILQRASQRMQEIIRRLAEERGLDVVMDVSNAVYTKPTLDITKDVVVAYDKAHPAK